MAGNDITKAISDRTDSLIAERVLLQRGIAVPLEIKGLKGKALRARANIDALNAAYDKFNVTAPAHVMDVEGLTKQVGGMQTDLEFAANVLGNSTEHSDTIDKEEPKTEQH